VSGVTTTIATALQKAGYRTREDLQEASTEELEKVENITHQDVLRIKVNVGG
jgi:predicted RecB family nuclease